MVSKLISNYFKIRKGIYRMNSQGEIKENILVYEESTDSKCHDFKQAFNCTTKYNRKKYIFLLASLIVAVVYLLSIPGGLFVTALIHIIFDVDIDFGDMLNIFVIFPVIFIIIGIAFIAIVSMVIYSSYKLYKLLKN